MKSIHLEAFPVISKKPDLNLISNIDAVRNICSNALSIRKDENIKVRIPLSKLQIFGKSVNFLEKYKDLIQSEINVKSVEIRDEIELVGDEKIEINFKTLGPKVGANLQKIIKGQKEKRYKKLSNGNIEIEGFEIEKSDFKCGFTIKSELNGRFCENEECVIILDTKITKELKNEGISRDFIRIIQQERKDFGLDVSDRIDLSINIEDTETIQAIKEHIDNICFQCLIEKISYDEKNGKEFEINEKIIKIVLSKHV